MTQSKTGDVRTYGGIRFSATEYLLRYDRKPRGVRWRAGEIADPIDEAWISDTGYRFYTRNVHSKSFEAAADRSLKGKLRDVENARALIAKYESINEADRALVAALP